MASGCVPGSGVADLPLRLVYGMRDSVPLNLLFTATYCRTQNVSATLT